MTQFGKITNYNETTGTGFIVPERGGEPLPFAQSDLQQQAEVPQQKERYGYDTQTGEGGEVSAVKLQKA